jgi:hypothetical protein
VGWRVVKTLWVGKSRMGDEIIGSVAVGGVEVRFAEVRERGVNKSSK